MPCFSMLILLNFLGHTLRFFQLPHPCDDSWLVECTDFFLSSFKSFSPGTNLELVTVAVCGLNIPNQGDRFNLSGYVPFPFCRISPLPTSLPQNFAQWKLSYLGECSPPLGTGLSMPLCFELYRMHSVPSPCTSVESKCRLTVPAQQQAPFLLGPFCSPGGNHVYSEADSISTQADWTSILLIFLTLKEEAEMEDIPPSPRLTGLF